VNIKITTKSPEIKKINYPRLMRDKHNVDKTIYYVVAYGDGFPLGGTLDAAVKLSMSSLEDLPEDMEVRLSN
jgi:hypothetical protein